MTGRRGIQADAVLIAPIRSKTTAQDRAGRTISTLPATSAPPRMGNASVLTHWVKISAIAIRGGQ